MKFRGQYVNTCERTSQDLSNFYEQTYVELAPFARDEKGEFLNDSPFPKLVEGDKVNIQERIDSFFEDVDLKHILARLALTGDISLLNKKQGFYGDISNIPDNKNDLEAYLKKVGSDFQNLPSNIRDLILNGASDDELNNAINSYVNGKLSDGSKTDNVKTDNVKTDNVKIDNVKIDNVKTDNSIDSLKGGVLNNETK